MDASKFEQKVKKHEIELVNVQKVNPRAYNDFVNRIRAMFCLDTVLKNSEYLYFSNDEIPNSKIKIRYLLLKGMDDKYIHLGIGSNNNKTYFGKTLLVTEGGAKEKYINQADCKLKVSKLTISRKHTTEIVECIERKKAYIEANGIIASHASDWIETNLSIELDEIKLREDIISDKIIKGWIIQLAEYLNQEKEVLRKQVEIYDPYWTKKIVAEEIRKYINNSARNDIDKFLNTV